MSTTLTTRPTTLQPRTSLRVCTAGSVDDGKSTFVGRLLHDTGNVYTDQLDHVTRLSQRNGHDGTDFSLLVDGLRAEREQGITIDVAYRYFTTPGRAFILADTPGHVQYTRNTVTGVSTADIVIILVDARHGIQPQTLNHLNIATLMGVRNIILAINKIDAVDNPEDVYHHIREEFLTHTAGHIPNLWAIPTSALHGDNVVQRSTTYTFYTGPSVLEVLSTIDIHGDDNTTDTGGEKVDTATDLAHTRALDLDFRLPVQTVIRHHATDYRGYAGRITAGQIRIGDTITTPAGNTTVTHIDTADGPATEAEAGNSVVLRLKDNIDIARGDLLAGENPPPLATRITATAIGVGERGVHTGDIVMLRYGTAAVRAKVLDGTVGLNDITTVQLQLQQPLPIEPYAARGAVGALLLIDPDSGDTLAAGLVQ